ncbi:lipid-A-disaccharide synthase [Fibrobacter sp.]|uniref:lipid-A-disaccharide synthase n=1 Tax=Fibrobacter sp. TaxID=35828 RepID=UPI0025BA48EF|nr:lipid-A-disaccharide synthase [Fibrobacter sp.]MBR3073298.1 lipid-A-disaccharide synthase [Fibrobacter sp.]
MRNVNEENAPYILFCVGEDSGDMIGAEMVATTVALGFKAMGVGGPLMQEKGLVPLWDYNELPVSGVGDVVPKYFSLKKVFEIVSDAAESKKCLAIVAVDYPGFNMRLARLAKKWGKPMLYVAPPQIWAWKSKRASLFKQADKIRLAVFFDIEAEAYKQMGCDTIRIKHPVTGWNPLYAELKSDILLLPGSRRTSALRNLPTFVSVAEMYRNAWAERNSGPLPDVVVVASRDYLEVPLLVALEKLYDGRLPTWLKVVVAPKQIYERLNFYSGYSAALTSFGTSTLEMAFVGIPFAACVEPDFLTFVMGKLMVKTDFLSLPNAIIGRGVTPEFIIRDKLNERMALSIVESIFQLDFATMDEIALRLRKALNVGKSSSELVSEFLAEFVKR